MAKKNSESTAKPRKRLSPEEKAAKAQKAIERAQRTLIACNAAPAIKLAQSCIKSLKTGDRTGAIEIARDLITEIEAMK